MMRRVSDYADYCPITTAVELLGDRWTMLVVRELSIGSYGFNEIHRGVPKMNRSLLTERLRNLERRGIVVREPTGRGRGVRYELTPAGQALAPHIWQLGHWAAEWMFGDPSDEELDGISLLWRMHQFTLADQLPPGRTVVHVTLTGVGAAQGWFDIQDGSSTLCRNDPGHEVALAVRADNRQMHRWMVGLASFAALVARGDVELDGPTRLARAFPTWFDTAEFTAAFRRGDLRAAEGSDLAS
jgi:DNA-binding HxlR family transcriptional regulator